MYNIFETNSDTDMKLTLHWFMCQLFNHDPWPTEHHYRLKLTITGDKARLHRGPKDNPISFADLFRSDLDNR